MNSSCWETALGIFQNPQTAEMVLLRLRKKGLNRSASIQRDHYGTLKIQNNRIFTTPLLISLSFFAALFILFVLFLPISGMALSLFALAGASFVVHIFYKYLFGRFDPTLLRQYTKLVISDETLVLVQVQPKDVSLVLSILRHVESGHPTSFLFRFTDFTVKTQEFPELVKEPLTVEQMSEHASRLAAILKEFNYERKGVPTLLYNLKKCEDILNKIHHVLAEAELVEQTVTLSAEWFLDNTYVIQGNIEEVRRNLPQKFYKELPKIAKGDNAGLPRVYVIARDIVDYTANRLNRENIINYLDSYQAVDPLTIAELWVLPLMLRLRLIEHLQYLAIDIDRRLKEGEKASFWGNRLLTVSKREPERMAIFLKDLESQVPNPSYHFAEELMDHLYDEESIIPLIRDWLERHFHKNIHDVIKEEQLQKSAEQIAISNAIVSLITLSQLSWRSIFEVVSTTDRILNQDPQKIYAQMDFNTRDSYRHAIEVIARGSKYSETEVANTVLMMAKEGHDEVSSHVGYYLIDKGRSQLEKNLRYIPTWRHFIRRQMINHPSSVYLGSIFTLTFALEVAFYLLMHTAGLSWTWIALMLVLTLVPASEISLQFVSVLMTNILQTFVIPKLSFEKGIPEQYKTLVVVPSLLSSREEIAENINRLEIHYLANSENILRFGIYYDFTDSLHQQTDKDQKLIDEAMHGIEKLEQKYGKGKFFLFSRNRVWSKSENAWIGRERKRGKLESLNRFLATGDCPELIIKIGDRKQLEGIRYVITLDADTELPKDTAKELIETIAHPLNVPRLSEDGKVLRGYTIIQPRVTPDIAHSRNTLFSQIYSDAQSVNPYTQTISDIYQDLMAEGNYHGKGIYDVQTFHKILCNCFPEEHLLSHDLLEGVHVRVGFASDIILTDLFPQDYYSWSKRLHRWMRGDWQIMDWIFSSVPCGVKERKTNPLSLINRWKIFDNLRRSLIPLSLMTILLLSFFILKKPIFWSSLVAFVVFIPTLCFILFSALQDIKGLFLSWKDFVNMTVRSITNVALLPHQAYMSLDVILRFFFRRFISGKKLLEWETFRSKSGNLNHQIFVIKLSLISLFAIFILYSTAVIHPIALPTAIPFCTLWLLAPLIVHILDKPRIAPPDEEITEEDRLFLRKLARKTWRYFDDFVGPQSNWLPPDNYQAALTIEIAQRTSPTNIGLWMLAVLGAHDLKYMTVDDVLDRLAATFRSFKRLEMYEGHFLNWYDIQNLKPLYPRYVSTVDSGNLLASFWTLEQGIYQLANDHVLPSNILNGLNDTLILAIDEHPSNHAKLELLKNQLSKTYKNTFSLILGIRKCLEILQDISESSYWIKKLEEQLSGFDSVAKRYCSWMDILNEINDRDLEIHIKECFNINVTLKMLSEASFPSSLTQVINAIEKKSQTSESLLLIKTKLEEALRNASWLAGEKLGQAKEISYDINQLCDGLNMSFLYNKERKLFSIGFHVDDCRLDTSYYDLLASEARIASFVAIAKNDVPLDHWWALGRPYGYIYGRHVLMSWGGTMFEYLMPLLFKNVYPDSLLGKGCKDAVACQQIYAERRGIPWGISEAAYSAIDVHRIYQYRSFGVPGLGFKRDLEEDLVVSPYSTALALAIDPRSAIKNFKVLEKREQIIAEYGCYESIDFTRQSAPQGKRGVIVYAFMAHHQGMSFLAINNLLNNNILRKRFHANPRVCGMESLLYEKVPTSPSISKGSRKEIPISRLTPFPTEPIMGFVETPHSAVPKVNILSNGNYSVMMTNAGGGYSQWKEIDITRWRSDITCDNWGSHCYIKDLKSGNIWSAAYHPTCFKGKKYSVSFKADRTEFKRVDNQIETHLEIVVSPEDDAEIRLLTIGNLSREQREIELTSYVELAMAPHATDAAHPCFNKLFIETESLEDIPGLLAFRRLRSPEDRPIFVGHVIASDVAIKLPLQFETDRDQFIGRGRTLHYPQALDQTLSGKKGFVLDPILSLRHQIKINPGQRVHISFVTAISDSREKTVGLLTKYADLSSSHRAIDMAWAHAQLELRHLRIHQEEVQLYQKLAGRILFPHFQLRPSSDRLLRNKKGQSGLWTYGISGDLPIIVVSIADIHEMDLVKQVLTSHLFLRMRGLKTDLVILNEESTGYEHPLFEQIQRLLQAFSGQIEIGKSGGVYLLNSDQIPEDDITLILAVASVNLIAARGSLRQQLVAPLEATTFPSRLIPNQRAKDFPSPPLPFIELKYFNDVGGFSPDGREYMIYLDFNKQTPAPWINVIANKKFGTIVSETGLGATWYENSQSNRLTPWSNDPLLNPISDTIYLRDEDLGTFWSPTPGPIRELDPYRIRHGAGYTRFEHNSHGIEQDLTIFVPIDDQDGLPLRIQRLKLKNSSNQKRRLSAYSYTEWVLGVDRERTQMHIITQWDAESQALFAYNRYNLDFGSHLGFVASIPLSQSFTGNRTEFIGRNGHSSNPAALKRKKLSGLTGPAYDPCAALQVLIELEPDEEKEIIFLLGYAQDEQKAREMIFSCREPDWIQRTYLDTLAWWDKYLGALQVDTPDPAINYGFNRWLLYQSLSCRFWGRTAFYQSSGAFGFRDQLQDAMAFLYTLPHLAREQILLCASRQFIEGDVQHWWHPPSNGGVRTRISDDLLWLPFVTAQYIRVTQDTSILNEEIPFIKGELLKEEQHEAYFIPEVSKESASLLEHCRRAIKKGLTEGPHGLPLMGGGDWNDGMNRVGIEGKGESVWLAWFLIHVMNDFADILIWSGQPIVEDGFRAQAKRLAETIEEKAWDGNWYRRAYFDDGTPLGSIKASEAIIDSISQSWAVISGAANPERVELAFQSLKKYIIKNKEKLVLLLTPPFNETPLDPGYIKGYPPGVRENGGQYTHGSLWVPQAFAKRGDGDQALELIRMMHPISHTSTKEEMLHYKDEPYVLAGDVYSLPSQMGRGGWSWYTGSSAWMYRILLEDILGFTLRGEILKMNPVLPKEWEKITMKYRYRETFYEIFIENTPGKGHNWFVELDDVLVKNGEIKLTNDGKTHRVKIKN